MFTIKQLVKEFNLSRSTLLYYDKIGLLKPSSRSESNYRIYSNSDLQRMEKIVIYRNAGIPLKAISKILDVGDSSATLILEDQLEIINDHICELRLQQKQIIDLLGSESALRSSKVMNKTRWTDMLKESGLDDEGMHQWHMAFEKQSPCLHTDFLKSLGIDSKEIDRIRQWAKK